MSDPRAYYRKLVAKADRLAAEIEGAPIEDSEVVAFLERITREVEVARARMKAFDGLAPLRIRAREDPDRCLPGYLDALAVAGLWGLLSREAKAEIGRIEHRIYFGSTAERRASRAALAPRLEEVVALYNTAIGHLAGRPA